MATGFEYYSPRGVALMTRTVTQAMEMNVKEFKNLTIKKKTKVGKYAESCIATGLALAPHVEKVNGEYFAQKWLFDTIKLSYFMGLREVRGTAIKLPSCVVNDALIVAGKECEKKIWTYMGNSDASEDYKNGKAADSVYSLVVFLKSNSKCFFEIVANYPNHEQLQGWLGTCFEAAARRAFASNNIDF